MFHKGGQRGGWENNGYPPAAPADTLRISLADVMAARLPERVLGFLDEPQVNTLLG